MRKFIIKKFKMSSSEVQKRIPQITACIYWWKGGYIINRNRTLTDMNYEKYIIPINARIKNQSTLSL